MCDASVGDEELGEDPTVNALEARAAVLLGKESAVFLPSGTMCNIVAYFVHCGWDGAVFIHEQSHPVYSSYMGESMRHRAKLHVLEGANGIIDRRTLGEAIEREAASLRGASVLSLENTHNRSGGSVWPLRDLQDVCGFAAEAGLRTHLDGARLLNAVAASGVAASAYGACVDSVWIDLSKGLGCPSGAVLGGTHDFVEQARRAKYLFGGVTHKAGIVAAAGIYALDHHLDRLVEDHDRARRLAAGLAALPGIEINPDELETNMVYFSVRGRSADEVVELLAERAVGMKAVSETRVRAVTHLDVDDGGIAYAIDAVGSVVGIAR